MNKHPGLNICQNSELRVGVPLRLTRHPVLLYFCPRFSARYWTRTEHEKSKKFLVNSVPF